MIGIDIKLIDVPERGQVVLEALRKTFPGQRSIVNSVLQPLSNPSNFIDLDLSETLQKFCMVTSDVEVDIEIAVDTNVFTFRAKVFLLEMPFTGVRITNFNVAQKAITRLVFG